MSRKNKRNPAPIAPEAAAEGLIALLAPMVEAVEAEAPTLADLTYDPMEDADVAPDLVKGNSVVKGKYKARYAERAVAAGHKGKVAKRSCWDWLAQCLAEQVLEKGKLNEAKFRALLDMNGVDHSRWQNKSKGWEGRLRMTGRLALQRVVAEAGILKIEDDELVAPSEWVAKFQN